MKSPASDLSVLIVQVQLGTSNFLIGGLSKLYLIQGNYWLRGLVFSKYIV
jgi:hypothetical protein